MALHKMNEISLDNASIENESKIILASSSDLTPSLYSVIKCSTNKAGIKSIEARWLRLIKISKSVVINLNNLTYINFSDNSLRKISRKFLLLKSLRVLCLDNNQISSMPSFLKDFPSLEDLALNGNVITSIPTSIQFCIHLKELKVSHNKIASLPIEFGLLKPLSTLHIDSNYFTALPTTLCYLKQLSDFKLEWFEFLEPRLVKEQKEAKGLQVITSMRSFLQEMLSNSQLYCDFNVFIAKANRCLQRKLKEDVQQTFETEKTEYQHNNPKNSTSIFFAVENSYYGVVKAFIAFNEDILKVKNSDGHTPFYVSIAFNQKDIINHMLSKINLKTFPNPYFFLHKAIKTRNYPLLLQLASMGIDLNSFDDQGSTSYHLLFSVFHKSIENCCLIGNFLLDKRVQGINTPNFEKWAPIHVAARRGSVDCIKWIQLQNCLRERKGEELFDFNLKGKNNWTPLHLSVSGFFYNETLLMISNGCDLFSKNKEGKTPRKVTHNYFLTKLLHFQERKALRRRYLSSLGSAKAPSSVKKPSSQSKAKASAYYSTEEILGSTEASLEEKFNALKQLKHNSSVLLIEKVVLSILKEVDVTIDRNGIVFAEVLDVVASYNLICVVSHIESIRAQLKSLGKRRIYLERAVDNTLALLHQFALKQCAFYAEADEEEESEMKTLQYEDNQTDSNYLMYFDEEQAKEKGTEREKEFLKEMNDSIRLNLLINPNKSENVIQPKLIDNNNSYDYISESIIQFEDDDGH